MILKIDDPVELALPSGERFHGTVRKLEALPAWERQAFINGGALVTLFVRLVEAGADVETE